jgi:hypothetical protein
MRRGLRYIINAPVCVRLPEALSLLLAPVANQAVGPLPLDVLHGATGLLEHDVAQAGVVGRGGAVGDGEVAASVVAREEDADVVDLTGAVVGVRGEGEAAVG